MKLHLLPQPQNALLTGGWYALALPLRMDPGPVGRQTAERLSQFIQGATKLPCSLAPKGNIALDLTSREDDESYKLSIRPRGIRLAGNGDRGLCHGIRTLTQILQQFGSKLPCLDIEDRPAFQNRGIYLDITRGKVPKIETLKRLVDRLSALKINQLQLYVEHVFDFAFDPDIGAGSDPLTARDIRELDRYCREHFVTLVPSLACFGHMGKVLSLPKYRKLAEVEWPARDWKNATWIQRLRGATLNPRLSGSRKLLERMLNDFLPCFSAPLFNMCGDETYDLGRSRAGGNPDDIARLYLDHLSFIRKLAARHGKRLMFWGDVMLQHRRAIRALPKDCVVLDWGYSPAARFEKIGKFIRCGLDAYACPSTRGYKVVFNEVEEARGNICGYARTAHRLGATGLLTTDWGDMGHFNLLPCSYHGMALGAAMAWNPGANKRDDFDRAFSLQFFGDKSGTAGRLYRKAGTTGLATWPYLIADSEGRLPFDRSAVRKAPRIAAEAAQWASDFRAMKPAAWIEKTDLEQLALACEAIGLNAQRMLIESHERASGSRRREFSKTLNVFSDRYRKAWLAVNRRSSLNELTAAFRKTAAGFSGNAK